MTKKIYIILPYKESLDSNIAGAVSLYVTDIKRYSKYKKSIKIISSEKVANFNLFTNRNYIRYICDANQKSKIDLFEVHNRPEYIKYIKKNFPKTKVTLTFHNDPLSLRDSKTIKEREYLIKTCSKIIFVSRWIQQRFFSGLMNANQIKTNIVYCGVNIPKFKKIKKKKKGLIAYIDFETNLEMDMFAQTWEESWEMDLIGLFNGTMQYNLTSHELIRSKNSGTVQGEGIDLEDDGKFTIMQNFSVDTRRKK